MGREELEAAKRLHSQIKDGLSEQLKNQEYEYGLFGLIIAMSESTRRKLKPKEFVQKKWRQGKTL